MKLPDLTGCEQVVMKCIWDAGRDISLVELMEVLKKDYGRDWKRSTICTFILHMTEKGYVTSYRNGRVFYYVPSVTEEEYLNDHANSFVEFWYHGNREDLMRSLLTTKKLTEEEKIGIRKLTDDTDF